MAERRIVSVLRSGAAALLLGATASAHAQAVTDAWPQRTVRLIVPNPSGVGLDVAARLFAQRLAERWGQAVIVENIPGADGNIAAREFVQRRDDHTLLYSFSGLITVNPLVHAKLPYDPDSDLVPIAPTSENALAFAVSSGSPAGSLADLARLAHSRPGALTWAATPGVPHYAFAAFLKKSGSFMEHVSYRDFKQAIVDLAESRIDVVAAGVAPLLPHVASGRLRLLAFINERRNAVAPDVPTVAEAGFPTLAIAGATGLFGWRGMPPVLRDRIAADVRAAGDDSAIAARLASIGSMVVTASPDEFAASIAEQRDRISAIARSSAPPGRRDAR